MASDEDSLTIGAFIDALIRAEQMEEEKTIGLTKFLGQIAKKADLSARQIGRIRDSADFPESNAIDKLIPVLAQQMRAIKLDDIAHRLLLPWDSILDDQNRLLKKSKNSTITIMAGWNPPRGLQEDSIAESMTEYLQKGIKYIFLYPHPSTYPQQETLILEGQIREIVNEWVDQLMRKIKGIWYQKLMLNPDHKSQNDTELLEEFKEKIREKIKVKHTKKETNLWNLLPSDFCVLYNIDLLDKKEEFCYGYFVVNGSIMLAKESKEVKRVKSYGHLYINNDDYLKIRKSYKESIE
jgi:hypothetical protein